jgi:hypothetical protein
MYQKTFLPYILFNATFSLQPIRGKLPPQGSLKSYIEDPPLFQNSFVKHRLTTENWHLFLSCTWSTSTLLFYSCLRFLSLLNSGISITLTDLSDVMIRKLYSQPRFSTDGLQVATGCTDYLLGMGSLHCTVNIVHHLMKPISSYCNFVECDILLNYINSTSMYFNTRRLKYLSFAIGLHLCVHFFFIWKKISINVLVISVHYC